MTKCPQNTLLSPLGIGCNKKFKSRSGCVYHGPKCTKGILVSPKKKAMHVVTNKGQSLKCRYCSSTFKQAASVSQHQHNDCNAACLLAGKSPKQRKGKKFFQCITCSRSFDRESKYQVHIKSHQRKKFQCSHCYKEFKREDNAQTHEAKCGEQLPTLASVPQYHQAGPSSLSTAAQPASQLNGTQMMVDPPEEAEMLQLNTTTEMMDPPAELLLNSTTIGDKNLARV